MQHGIRNKLAGLYFGWRMIAVSRASRVLGGGLHNYGLSGRPDRRRRPMLRSAPSEQNHQVSDIDPAKNKEKNLTSRSQIARI